MYTGIYESHYFYFIFCCWFSCFGKEANILTITFCPHYCEFVTSQNMTLMLMHVKKKYKSIVWFIWYTNILGCPWFCECNGTWWQKRTTTRIWPQGLGEPRCGAWTLEEVPGVPAGIQDFVQVRSRFLSTNMSDG